MLLCWAMSVLALYGADIEPVNSRMAAVRFGSIRTKSGSGSHRFRFTRNSGSKRFRFTPIRGSSTSKWYFLDAHVRASGGSSTSRRYFFDAHVRASGGSSTSKRYFLDAQKAPKTPVPVHDRFRFTLVLVHRNSGSHGSC